MNLVLTCVVYQNNVDSLYVFHHPSVAAATNL